MNKTNRLLFLMVSLTVFIYCNTGFVLAINPDSFAISAICDIWLPAPVTDLVVTTASKQAKIKLNWTAPEENKNKLPATNQPVSGYMIKFATFTITEFNGDARIWWEKANYQIEQGFAQNPGIEEELVINIDLVPERVYYFAICSYDKAGNWSEVSNIVSVQKADNPPPANIGTVSDGPGIDLIYVNSPTQLSANWTPSFDLESGLARYWYAVGTTAGGADVVDWTDNGLFTSVTSTGLSLGHGKTYYFTVKAENADGLQSEPTSSDGQTLDIVPPETTINTYGPLFIGALSNFAPLDNQYNLTAKDGLAGVDYILIGVDGKDWQR